MARRFYKLPSLTSLNSFDACARHGSLTQAARELGVTLGAVSRQLKTLEQELDCQLFTRHHRGVELTLQGSELQLVLSNSFREIGRVCQSLRNRATGSDVTIAATTAFASLWLLPRLGSFWSEHQAITLNHSISDNPDDAAFAQADIRIRYGDGHWTGEEATRLFGDVIYPVCGIEFAQAHAVSGVDDLVSLPLLQLEGLDRGWTTWSSFIAHWNLDLPGLRLRRFNNYVVALQAAQENQGVALGWHSQVAALIQRGKLACLGTLEIPAPGSFYLCWDARHLLSPEAELLRTWLLKISADNTAAQPEH